MPPILYWDPAFSESIMIKNDINFLLIEALESKASKLADELLKSTSKPSKHINYQIELLEVLTYEIKRYDHLGYCDFELGLLCLYITRILLQECKNHPTDEIQDLIAVIDLTIHKKETKVKSFETHITENNNNHSNHSSQFGKGMPFSEKEVDLDPLISRFNQLNPHSTSPSPSPSSGSGSSPAPEEFLIETFKYTEIITASELNHILSKKKHDVSVLLIDFRTKNEFNYNHINFKEIVNIEPAMVNSLLAFDNQHNATEITDQDLEERLRLQLPDDQYHRFQQRYKYDLVVICNLKYGIAKNSFSRFDSLIDLLINGDVNGNPSKNPFAKLIDLLAYRNKYISSKLKRCPCYLSGGVSFWYSVFGENSIAKTATTPMLARPPASLSKDGSSSPSSSRRNSYMTSNSNYKSSDSLASISSGSPYLKNFGDYLGTAKTSKDTPVSNNFVGGKPSLSSLRSNSNGYVPSAPLKPPSIDSNINGDFRSSTSSPDLNTRSITLSEQQAPVTKASIPTILSTQSLTPSTNSLTANLNGKSSNPIKFLEQYTTGLTNLGNSCYMNCVLQCLAATPELTRFFFPTFPLTSSSPAIQQSYRQHINVNNKLGTKGILTTNFVNLLMNMFGNTGGYFTPLHFKKVIGSLSPGQQFANFDQQDCIEFLTFLLDSLHEDLNQMVISNPKEKQAIMELTPEQEKTREYLPVRLASTIEWERYLKLNFSIIVDYFQGQYLSQLKCLECGLTSTTYNAFLILSLPIPEKLNTSSDVTLDDCLQEFVQTELLDEQNKWHCPRCKKFTRLTKKITITRLPQVLIIHFKRFKLSPTGYFSKMDTFIKYPVNDILDLTSYWPDVGTVVNPAGNKSELMPKEKEAQILSTLPTRNQVPPFRYKLYAVANHYGNLTTGHYTSYVYKGSDKKKTRNWCYFDDSKVTFNHRESQVLNRNAYCLFYQRV